MDSQLLQSRLLCMKADSTIRRYLIPPSVPASHLSPDKKTIITHFPEYSQDSSALKRLLEKQAEYPPIFTARVRGVHLETVHMKDIHMKDKKEKTTVVDFDIRLDMTHLLVPHTDTPNNLRIQGLQHTYPRDRTHRG